MILGLRRPFPRTLWACVAATAIGAGVVGACLPGHDDARGAGVRTGEYASSFALRYDNRFPAPDGASSSLRVDRESGMVEVRFATDDGEIVQTWVIVNAD